MPSVMHKSKFQKAKKWRFQHDPKQDVSAKRLLSNIGRSTDWPYYKLVAFDAINKGKNKYETNGTDNSNTNAG